MKINRAYDVPYLAGSSKRTGETYIDRRIPKTLTVKGKTFDPAKYLAIHEQTEHPLMMKGMAYETAHREALKAERKAVEADGIKWSDYQEQMGHMAAKTQREKIRTAPPDLYTKPYPHTEARLLQKDAAHKAAGGGVQDAPAFPEGFVPDPAPAASSAFPAGFVPDAPTTAAPPQATPPAPSWSEVPGLAAKNFVPTAAHAVVQGVEGIPNMVKGVGSALGDALNPMNLVNSWTPEGQQAMAAKGAQEEATLKGAAQGAYNKYGTGENLRRTLAYDPGGALLDASTVLGGAGAVADVAKLGRVGDALGAASSVTNPANYPGAIVRGVGKAMGNSAEPARTALSNAGVSLTPGQMLGGQFKSIEDAATSIPLLGDFVQSGRQNSIESFNRAVGNQALQPIGEAVSKSAKAGHDLINDVQSKISDRYDALKPNLIWQPDQKFLSDVNALRNGRVSTLPASQAGQFDGIIRHAMRGSFAPMNGTLFKNVESDLATTAASYASSPMAAERELGNSLNDYLTAMRGALERSNPQHAEELANLNSSWAMYTRMRQAAARRATGAGVFTPSDLLAAAKSGDRSVGKGSFARGNALMQTFAEAGQKVLPSTVPDSGTARRLGTMGALAASSVWLHNPAIALGGIGAAMPYTRPGMWATNRFVAPAVRGIASGLPTAALLGYQLGNAIPDQNGIGIAGQ